MTAIIFDFDGTIANTFDYTVAFLAREAGQAPPGKSRKAEFHGLSMARIARRLGLPWRRLPGLFFKGRREMSPAMDNIEPFTGIPELLGELRRRHHELFILSTNTTRNINKFLRRHGLEKRFKAVYGGVGMFGKTPALRRLLNERHIEPSGAIYVGDELRDVMAARALGVRVIAVTWGFAGSDDLKSAGVDGLAHRPQDLRRLLEKLA